MRRHILLLPDIADGGFECVSLRLIIPHDRAQMQMDTEAGGQKKTRQSREISIQKRALIACLFSRRWKELKGQHT